MNNESSTTLLHPVFTNLEQVIIFRRVEDITRLRKDMDFMFEWQEQYLTNERIHIFEPPCSVLFIIWTCKQYRIDQFRELNKTIATKIRHYILV